jgi:hypothetical protein
MIKRIKIFGERNSGTNFLFQLLHSNIKDIELCSPYYKGGTGWKHGIPRLDLFENMIHDTLFVFIIRDLESWLKSMYNEPYHLIKSTNIESFLNKKMKSCDERKDHDVNIYQEEMNKTIFELRYYKINKYIETFNIVKNAIIINLEDLQLDYGEKFIKEIHNKFSINILPTFVPIRKHTKTNEEIQNKTTNVFIDNQIIKIKKNKKIEDFVENLKNNYYIKYYLHNI